MLKVTAAGEPEPADRGRLFAVLLALGAGAVTWAVVRRTRNRRR